MNKELLNASWWGRTETVAMLLEKGADVNAKNNDGETALIRAIWWGSTETVAMPTGEGS